ncbi:hypothetical protein BGZ68_008158, partial [Mortierella alpina]
ASMSCLYKFKRTDYAALQSKVYCVQSLSMQTKQHSLQQSLKLFNKKHGPVHKM